jgi:quercetin dioxygenase-like cupin family protein
MKKLPMFVVCTLAAVASFAQSATSKSLVLEKNEGELRVRRPRSVQAPTSIFNLKLSPQNGSQHFVVLTEKIPPGGVIARHRHTDQDEILLIQTGSAHVTLDKYDYEVHAGGMIFLPARSWIGLKNISQESIDLVAVFSAPGFDRMMRCVSVPDGRPAKPISNTDLC